MKQKVMRVFHKGSIPTGLKLEMSENATKEEMQKEAQKQLNRLAKEHGFSFRFSDEESKEFEFYEVIK